MDVTGIAELAAALGVIATVIWIALAIFGIRTLREIKDELRGRRRSG